MRSPVSSAGGGGLPGSEEGSVKGFSVASGNGSSEIAIETMSQALRRTGSGELGCAGAGAGGVRSFSGSPI